MRVQRARFDHAVSRHIGALQAGRSEIVLGPGLDAISEVFLAAHRANFGATSPLCPRNAGDRPLRLVVLANKDLPQCTFYRIDLKAEQLRAAGDVSLQVFERSESEAFRSAAATADVALFYRLASDVEVLDASPPAVPWVYLPYTRWTT